MNTGSITPKQIEAMVERLGFVLSELDDLIDPDQPSPTRDKVNFVKEQLESFSPGEDASGEAQQPGWYEVEVSRSCPSVAEFEVYATSYKDAEEKAIDQASNHEFSSGHGADYQVEGSRFIRE